MAAGIGEQWIGGDPVRPGVERGVDLPADTRCEPDRCRFDHVARQRLTVHDGRTEAVAEAVLVGEDDDPIDQVVLVCGELSGQALGGDPTQVEIVER